MLTKFAFNFYSNTYQRVRWLVLRYTFDGRHALRLMASMDMGSGTPTPTLNRWVSPLALATPQKAETYEPPDIIAKWASYAESMVQ